MISNISIRLFKKKEGKVGKLPVAQAISGEVFQKGKLGKLGNSLRRNGSLSYQGLSLVFLLSLFCLETLKPPP